MLYKKGIQAFLRLVHSTSNIDLLQPHHNSRREGLHALGHPTTVKVGGQALSTNVYSDTGDKLLQRVEYGNGGDVRYAYDAFKRTTGISYDGESDPKFVYEYGANGMVGSVKEIDYSAAPRTKRESRVSYDTAERPVTAEVLEWDQRTYHLLQRYDKYNQPSKLSEEVAQPGLLRGLYETECAYDVEGKPTNLTYRSAQTKDPELIRMGQLKYVPAEIQERGVLHLKAPDDPQEVFAEYTVPAPPTEYTETPAQRKLVYEYDELGRAIRRILYKDEAGSSDADVLWTRYNYADGGHGSGSTTGLVHLLEQSDRQTIYTYDAVGNITEEETYGRSAIETRMAFQTEHNELLPLVFETKQLPLSMELDKRSYAYDKMGQLTRADIQNAGESWTYAYDQGGNILRKTRYEYAKGSSPLGAVERDISYTYGDPNWKDKLTAYNGRAITYDAIGNPLTYNGREYVWQKGRELAAIKEGGYTAVSFTYDHTGLRATKWSYGAETHYTYNGTKLTHLKNEVKNVQMHFYYDAQGRASMVRYNGVDYAYAHNLQGDVIRLIDMDGNSVVEYLYDPWGALIQTRGSMKSTLGLHNPLRYRGYVYDEETGLYVTDTRYYNPEWGLFLNADMFMGKTGALLSHNVFAYCDNNPVNLSDPTGLWSEDNWSKVVPFSRSEAYEHNRLFRDGTDAKENVTLHILADGDEKMVSIEAKLDPIGDNYHIDARFPSDSKLKTASKDAMKEVAGERWGKDMIVPAVLEFSDGTLAACSVNLYPHTGSGKNREFKKNGGGHFDIYPRDSKQSSSKPSKEVLKFQRMAVEAMRLARYRASGLPFRLKY